MFTALHEMNRLKIIVFLASLLVLRPVMGQRDDAQVLLDMRTRELMSMSVGKVRYELLDKDLEPAVDIADPLLRVSRKAGAEWAVRILSSDGLLVMTGTYTDPRFHTANGRFTYYHGNGRVESIGMYLNGSKRGAWYRFDARGNLLGERIYGEHDSDTLELKNGWSTVARTR